MALALTYIPGSTLVHRLDARIKLALLLVYSVTLFMVDSWPGMVCCVAIFAVCCRASRLPARRLLSTLAPIYLILAFMLATASFTLDVPAASAAYAEGASGLAASFAPVPLAGSFGFVPTGFERGCFSAARIVLLVLTSLIVAYTSSSTELTDAMASILAPLRRLGVDVDDASMIFSIALRFIPVLADELVSIRKAQMSRGAGFEGRGVLKLLRAWSTVLIPLFVSLFRRADRLSTAMDARCYGADPARTRLQTSRIGREGFAVLLIGVAACVLVSVFL